MLTIKKFLFSGVMLFSVFTLIGQEQLGIRSDNFMGINSAILNPSNPSTSYYNWTVNLAEMDYFLQNNYVFFEESSLLSLLSNEEDYVYGPNNRLRDIPREGLTLDFFEDGKDRYGFSNLNILGPSFHLRLNPNQSIGFITRGRFAGSITGIPTELSFYDFNNTLDQPEFTMDESVAAFMGWTEFGLNFVHEIETANGRLAIGATIKYLQGHEAAYVFNEIPIQLQKASGDSIISSSGQIEFAYTTSPLDMNEFEFDTNGSGWGIDLGANYTIGGTGGNDYKWKLGFSILDIGRIRFNQRAKRHLVSTDTEVVFGGPQFREFDQLSETEDALALFSEQILGDSDASLIGREFSMFLPGALSIQVDYQLITGIYINGTILQGVPLGRNGLRRANVIGLTPRIEKKWFGASMPISFYNFDQLRVGLSTRLGPFFLGSDDIGSIFQRSDLTGTDLFFGLRIFPFGKGNGGGADGRGGGRNGEGPRCYKF